jgi:chromosome segregation ATPase
LIAQVVAQPADTQNYKDYIDELEVEQQLRGQTNAEDQKELQDKIDSLGALAKQTMVEMAALKLQIRDLKRERDEFGVKAEDLRKERDELLEANTALKQELSEEAQLLQWERNATELGESIRKHRLSRAGKQCT